MLVTKNTERVNFDATITWRDDVTGVETPVVQITSIIDSSTGSTQSFKNVFNKTILDEHKDEVLVAVAQCETSIEERIKALGLDFYSIK